MNQTDRVQLLIEVFFDLTARIDEKDDAAMDLADFDKNRALEALIQVAQDENEDSMVLNSCGESIGEHWIRRNIFPVEAYFKLRGDARYGVYYIIKNENPDWVKKYNMREKGFSG